MKYYLVKLTADYQEGCVFFIVKAKDSGEIKQTIEEYCEKIKADLSDTVWNFAEIFPGENANLTEKVTFLGTVLTNEFN